MFFNSFRQFSIPLFVLISGALLINKDYSLTKFIRKKFNRIFVPYIFWAIALLIFSFIMISFGIKTNVISDFSIGYILNSALGFTSGFQKGRLFWFIWMILTVYVILFMLNKVLIPMKEENRKKAIGLLTLAFVIYCLVALQFDLIDLSPYKNFLAYYISFAGYGILGYYLANADFANIGNKLKLQNRTVFLIASAIFLILFIYFLIMVTGMSAAKGKIASVNYFGILTLVMSSSIFLSFRYFEESYKDKEDSLFVRIKDGKAGELINSLSICSFGIYFIHPMVYIFYRDVLFGSLEILKLNPIKWSSIMIVLVLLTSWAIIWAMSKVPYLEKVSGT